MALDDAVIIKKRGIIAIQHEQREKRHLDASLFASKILLV